MGLDMYLTKKTYIGAEYQHRDVTGSIEISIKDKRVTIDFNKISYIEERAAYWRKANHIHNWFVAHVQDNVDDCGEYEVTQEHLEQLLKDCTEVINGVVTQEEGLPTKSGFFFGSTEYGEYYKDAIMKTIDICNMLIPIMKESKHEVDIYYHSSW